MTRRTLHTLAAIVVGLLLLLVVLRSNDDYDETLRGDPLLPDFRAIANSANEIRLLRAGEDTVTLQRQDKVWVVTASDGYPADVSKLRQLIVALADAAVLEEKTANPDNYDKLGVGDPDGGGKGTKVVVEAPDASVAIILGNAAQGNYRYARVADQPTSYLIDQNPDLPTSSGEWLLAAIVDIAADSVQRVTITHADEETIVIEKSAREQTDFVVPEVPAGRELSYATVGNGIAAALANLEMEDVRRAIDGPAATTAVFQTWDGLTIAAAVVTDDDEHWVSFTATAGADDVGEIAAEIKARTDGWQYRLPDYKKNLLVRRWDDLLKSAAE